MAEVAGAFDPATELGPRLRQVREERGLSARELARRINCSPSLVSQIERGVSAPSVGMLYALASELRASLDFLFGVGPSDGLTVTAHGDGRTRPAPPAASAGDDGPAEHRPAEHRPAEHRPAEHRPAEHRPAEHRSAERWPAGHGIVQRAGSRRTIDLASGVRWERLTPGADDRVDFLEVVYEPRGHSTDARRALRHDGYEYGLIMSGTLQARVGFESYELGAGDSIAFDSSIPHEYWNTTADEVRAVWAVVHAHPGRP